jgi:hypothetical protein
LAYGQDKFPNTLFLNDSIGSPKADLSNIEWIEGHWRGEAFGGITEEVWTPALGKSMMCTFKLVVNGEVNFYELVTISEEHGSLIMRLKHFHSNLSGWEEKDKTVDFKLVKVTKNKVYFDRCTFEKISDNEMNVYVVIQNGEQETETKFNYKKVKK